MTGGDLLPVVDAYLAGACSREALADACDKAKLARPGMYGPMLAWRGQLLGAMHDARVGLGAPPAESAATALVLRVRLPGDGEHATGPLVRDLVNGVLKL